MLLENWFHVVNFIYILKDEVFESLNGVKLRFLSFIKNNRMFQNKALTNIYFRALMRTLSFELDIVWMSLTSERMFVSTEDFTNALDLILHDKDHSQHFDEVYQICNGMVIMGSVDWKSLAARLCVEYVNASAVEAKEVTAAERDSKPTGSKRQRRLAKKLQSQTPASNSQQGVAPPNPAQVTNSTTTTGASVSTIDICGFFCSKRGCKRVTDCNKKHELPKKDSKEHLVLKSHFAQYNVPPSDDFMNI